MNSTVIYQRYPYDDFTFNLFEKIINLYDVNGLFIYAHHWAFRESRLDYFDLINNAEQKLIILGIKDHYLDEMDHLFTEMALKNTQKKFILIMSPENLKNKILNGRPNIIDVLCWGGDWTNQIKLYQDGNVPIIKKFTDFTFTCHMRSSTKDRQIMLSLLFGLEIDRFGLITARDWFNTGGAAYTCGFYSSIYTHNDNIIKIIENGDARAKDAISNILFDPSFEDDVFSLNMPPLNFENFRKYLKPNYEGAPIDIVVESEMVNEAPFFTEKTLHCFYSKSLPIIITGKGAIQHLRDVGFDVFDDIIDHTYDLIDDRLMRMYAAINKNLHLLVDKDLIIKKYNAIDPARLDHNVNIIKHGLCDFYEQRLVDDYTRVIQPYIERK